MVSFYVYSILVSNYFIILQKVGGRDISLVPKGFNNANSALFFRKVQKDDRSPMATEYHEYKVGGFYDLELYRVTRTEKF